MWQLVPASPTWTIIRTKIKYDLIFNQAVSDKQYKIIKFLIYIYLCKPPSKKNYYTQIIILTNVIIIFYTRLNILKSKN